MPSRVRSIAPPATTAAAPRPGPDALAAAAGIGERLVREAVWYRAQCNWVGIERDSEDGGERRQAVHCSLGPALADGTAGVALFLAQLHAATGDGAVRRTALGAIAQALGQIDQVPAERRARPVRRADRDRSTPQRAAVSCSARSACSGAPRSCPRDAGR